MCSPALIIHDRTKTYDLGETAFGTTLVVRRTNGGGCTASALLEQKKTKAADEYDESCTDTTDTLDAPLSPLGRSRPLGTLQIAVRGLITALTRSFCHSTFVHASLYSIIATWNVSHCVIQSIGR